MRELWAANRNKMPANCRSLVVYDWLPSDRRYPFTLQPQEQELLPRTVRFELRRVRLSDDATTGAVQIMANGTEIAVEGYHTVGR